jgi:Protein of unknown function (DUF3970)
VKVRLHGTREEVVKATRRLAEAFDVVAVSRSYPDRGASTLVRVYLEVRLTPTDQPPPATASDRRLA